MTNNSSVLHDMIVSCSGPKRIQLPETARTIKHVIHLHRKADFVPTSKETVLVELSDLAHFLKKYDCALGREMLLKIVYYYRARDWPPICLLLVGLPLDNLKLFAQFLDTFKAGEDWLWRPPSTPTNHKFPKKIPRDAFCQLSPSQLWALRMARVGYIDKCSVEGGKELIKCGERFLHYLNS